MNNPHAAFEHDLEGLLQDANPAAEELSGYTRDELRGMPFLEVICPESHGAILDLFHQVLDGTPGQAEVGLRRKDGMTREVSVVSLPVVVDGRVVGVHGTAEDVTARNRAERELRDARRTADEANAAKSLLLANMSHELRTPLTTMVATAEMLEDTDLDPLQARFVEQLQRAGSRLSRLIDDILDFSSLESGRLELRPEPFDVRALLREQASWARERAAQRDLDFALAVAPDVPTRLVADPLRVSQVLDNLLDNALKFTAKGGVELVAEVASRRGDTVDLHLDVRDTGIGLPTEEQEGLFAPFTQLDPSPTRSHEGVGLGLAICRELVGLMQGTITLDSTEGRGTTVSVQLPVQVG